MAAIQDLRWDEWNVGHIARHAVTREEVEEVWRKGPMGSETYKGRVRLIGTTDAGRVLTVILEPVGDDIYYPITARPASRKERRRYQEYLGGEEE